MTAEDDGPTDDPYGIDLPAGWTAATDGETTRYERSDGSLRVEITEFSRGLSLYWWVNVYASEDDGWRRVEVGLGDSFTRADAVTAAVKSFFETVDEDGAVPAETA